MATFTITTPNTNIDTLTAKTGGDIFNLSDLESISKDIKCCIYVIKNIITDKLYIGQTKGILRNRIKKHIRESTNHSYNSNLYASFNKNGIENFNVAVLELCEEKDLNDKEKKWIAYLQTMSPNGYNLTSGGGQGTVYTKELILILSNSAKNKDKSVFKKHAVFMKQLYIENPEKREFMSEVVRKTHTGRKQSNEWVEKRASKKRGTFLTEEQKITLARAHMNGRIICCSNGKEYLSSYEAGLDTGADKDKIGLICNGKRKTSRGFSFWYKK
jgi:group I intron endonuclease